MKEQWTAQQKLWIWGKTFLRAMGPLALYVLMPALCLSLGYVALHPEMSAQEFFTYGGNFYSALGMILTILVLYARSKSKNRSFLEDTTLYFDRMDVKKAAMFLFFGASAALAVSALLTLLPRWGVAEGYSQASRTMFNGRDMIFTVLTTVVTAPLAEEIIFRGYMLNIFLETFDERRSIWIVSLIFALCHGQALWILYALAMGLLLAWVSVREDNILYGFFLHSGFNLPSVLIWLAGSFEGTNSLFFGSPWLIAAYGLIGLLLCILLAKRLFGI